jgi:hypothetical protein
MDNSRIGENINTAHGPRGVLKVGRPLRPLGSTLYDAKNNPLGNSTSIFTYFVTYQFDTTSQFMKP